MKCISLWQPWATLIAIGAKRIETRSWDTNYRGQLLIHAARKWNRELKAICTCPPIYKPIMRHLREYITDSFNTWDRIDEWFPRGVIVGVVTLDKTLTIGDGNILVETGEHISSTEWNFGDYTPGRTAWMLTNARRFPTPIPYVGHQRLFDVPDDLIAEQLAKAVPA
jgi:hypothetical protein